MTAGLARAQVCRTIEPDARDALIASPANHKVLYENADVRVLEVSSQPHTQEAMHTHSRPSVMYTDSQGAGKYMTPDNPQVWVRAGDPNFKFKIVALGPEGLHATANLGDVPFHAIRVEFKHPGCSLSSAPAVKPGPDDALVAAPKNHTLLFENDDVRVLDVHVQPHEKEEFHTHPWDGFFYVIQRASLVHFVPGAPASTPMPKPPDGAKIIHVGPEGPHALENVGDTPLHFIRFELKHAAPTTQTGR
jgi:quercetin dioxygenase-like cupin family protein